MTDDVHWVLALSIKRGKEAEVEALMAEMVAATREEPGAMAYEWLRNGASVHLYERYEDNAAAMVHIRNFAANFLGRFLDLFDLQGVSLYGPASADVREAMGGFGAVHYERVGGFSR